MNAELTLEKLDVKIEQLSDRFDRKFELLSGKFDTLSSKVDDVLDVINTFATSVDKRFDHIDERFDQNDRAHAEMRAEFGSVARKGNTKLTVLIDSLVSEKSLDAKAAQRILALEPYAQG